MCRVVLCCAVLCCAVLCCAVACADHVVRALQQLGFDEWATEVRASHEEFKEEAKSECHTVAVPRAVQGILALCSINGSLSQAASRCVRCSAKHRHVSDCGTSVRKCLTEATAIGLGCVGRCMSGRVSAAGPLCSSCHHRPCPATSCPATLRCAVLCCVSQRPQSSPAARPRPTWRDSQTSSRWVSWRVLFSITQLLSWCTWCRL
jgi:hypothetical protein